MTKCGDSRDKTFTEACNCNNTRNIKMSLHNLSNQKDVKQKHIKRKGHRVYISNVLEEKHFICLTSYQNLDV